MDYDLLFNNQGCNGGMYDVLWKFVSYNGGLCSEESYPYTSGKVYQVNVK
ncbi:MAG: C1 family peptidase [Candidatus Fonsibacter sp.]